MSSGKGEKVASVTEFSYTYELSIPESLGGTNKAHAKISSNNLDNTTTVIPLRHFK